MPERPSLASRSSHRTLLNTLPSRGTGERARESESERESEREKERERERDKTAAKWEPRCCPLHPCGAGCINRTVRAPSAGESNLCEAKLEARVFHVVEAALSERVCLYIYINIYTCKL